MTGYKIEMYKKDRKTLKEEVFRICREIPSLKSSSNKDCYLNAVKCLDMMSNNGTNDLNWLAVPAKDLFIYASERNRCESRKVFEYSSENYVFTTFFECI